MRELKTRFFKLCRISFGVFVVSGCANVAVANQYSPLKLELICKGSYVDLFGDRVWARDTLFTIKDGRFASEDMTGADRPLIYAGPVEFTEDESWLFGESETKQDENKTVIDRRTGRYTPPPSLQKYQRDAQIMCEKAEPKF